MGCAFSATLPGLIASSSPGGRKGMGGILHYPQMVALGERMKVFNVHHHSTNVHRDDSPNPGFEREQAYEFPFSQQSNLPRRIFETHIQGVGFAINQQR